MELRRIENGKHEDYKINDTQVLRVGKNGKCRLIYPMVIEGKKIYKNWFKFDSGMLVLTVVFLLALYLIAHNYQINTEQCMEITNDPYGFCNRLPEERNIGISIPLGELEDESYNRNATDSP